MNRPVMFTSCLIALALSGLHCGKNETPRTESIAPAPAASAQQAPAEVRVRLVLDGKPAAMPAIKMNADAKCLSMHKQPAHFQTVMANAKGMLQNVFVYVKEGLGTKSYPSPTNPVVLNQHGCMYEPHVLGIMVDQPLEIVNRDPLLHNIHVLAKDNQQFNVAQPKEGMKMEKKFSTPEVMVPVKCDVHSWMRSYIGVLNHPFYAVSDSDGACDIKGIPPGDLVLSAWHEEYGSQDQHITLKPGEVKDVEFRFKVQ